MGAPRAPSPSRRGWEVIAVALRPHRHVAAIGILTGLAWSATKLALPALIGRTIDRAVVPGDRDVLLDHLALLLAVGVLGATISSLRRRYAQGLGWLVDRDIRRRLVTHLHRLHLGFHRETPNGLLISRAGSDLLQIQQPFIMIPMLMSASFMLIGAAVLLGTINLPLMLVALSPTALILVAALRFTARLKPRSESLQNGLADLASVVEESVAGIQSVKGLGAEQSELRRLEDRAARVYEAATDLAPVRATYLPLFELLPALGLIATLWLGSLLVDRGALTIGQLVQFNAYVLMLVGPLRIVGITLSNLQRALVSAGLIGELLDVAPEIVDPPRPVPLPRAGGEIRFDRVTFTHPGAPSPALADIDLVVGAGKTVALVGATGSGKTTLAALVSRLDDVTAGTVSIDGVDVRDARVEDVRARVTTVFEDTFLSTGTIAENIAFAAPGSSREAVERAARIAGADDFVSALDEGYETVVGERGAGLSGGQRQRLAIARAVLTDAPIVVLDSATSAVDAVKEAEILDALDRTRAGRTTLLVAHRATTIARADRVVLLHEGRIADTGTHRELLTRSALYRQVLAQDEDADDAGPGGLPAADRGEGVDGVDGVDGVELVS